MKLYVRLFLSLSALVILPHFSSQNSKTGGKPDVNFYGKVTDSRETFKAENITIEREIRGIPVYQQPPAEEKELKKDEASTPAQKTTDHDKKTTSQATFDPHDNVTRLDLSEIYKITVSPHQMPRRIGNRDYITLNVYSKDADHTQNTYMIEADKKLFFDQVNAAGPIEKEIKMKAVDSIELEGYKQNSPVLPEKKESTSVDTSSSKTKRLVSYVKNALGIKVSF